MRCQDPKSSQYLFPRGQYKIRVISPHTGTKHSEDIKFPSRLNSGLLDDSFDSGYYGFAVGKRGGANGISESFRVEADCWSLTDGFKLRY